MENRDILVSRKKYEKLLFTDVVIGLIVLMRILPHVPNITPIGALALFSGCYFSKRIMIILTLSTLFISDFFLGFHPTMLYVYSSYIIIGYIGVMLRKYGLQQFFIGGSILSSLIFFFITNFGVWFSTSYYPHTLEGFIRCYVLALAFLRNTIIGDLLYTISFFGGYAVLKRTFFITMNKAIGE